MIAGMEGGLQKIIDILNATSERYEMKIYRKKSKVMRVTKKAGGKVTVQVSVIKLEQVQSFNYLGSTLTDGSRCETSAKEKNC